MPEVQAAPAVQRKQEPAALCPVRADRGEKEEGEIMLMAFFRRVIARFRWNKRLVCEQSVGRGLHDDYHDYPDSIEGQPWHFVELTCKRCGKKFVI